MTLVTSEELDYKRIVESLRGFIERVERGEIPVLVLVYFDPKDDTVEHIAAVASSSDPVPASPEHLTRVRDGLRASQHTLLRLEAQLRHGSWPSSAE